MSRRGASPWRFPETGACLGEGPGGRKPDAALTIADSQKEKIGAQILMVFSSVVDLNALYDPVDYPAWTRVVGIEACTHAQVVSK
jgi:hypothetical protein